MGGVNGYERAFSPFQETLAVTLMVEGFLLEVFFPSETVTLSYAMRSSRRSNSTALRSFSAASRFDRHCSRERADIRYPAAPRRQVPFLY